MDTEVKTGQDINSCLIRIGDHIAYAAREGRSARLRQGIVESFKGKRVRVRFPNGQLGGYVQLHKTIKVHL